MRRELPWVLYVVILVIALVPVLYAESDEFSVAWIAFWLAQLGLGLGVARPWVAIPALISCAMLVVIMDFGGWGWLLLASTAPCGVGLAVAGYGLAVALGRWATPTSLAVFAIALLPGLAGVADALRHTPAERLPAAVQRQLPIKYSLGNLCPLAHTPQGLEEQIRRQAAVLLRELRRRPDALVSYTYEYEDRDPETKEITVRALAEQSLSDLPERCAPKLRERLQRALRSS